MIFFILKQVDILFVLAHNIDSGYTLEPHIYNKAVLTSTHNLCLGA